MTRAVDDLEREIRMLSDEDKIELFKVFQSAFRFFEQAQSGADDLTDRAVASVLDLCGDELVEMRAKRDAGVPGHQNLLYQILVLSAEVPVAEQRQLDGPVR